MQQMPRVGAVRTVSTPNQIRTCPGCRNDFHAGDRKNCPAFNQTCRNCGRTGHLGESAVKNKANQPLPKLAPPRQTPCQSHQTTHPQSLFQTLTTLQSTLLRESLPEPLMAPPSTLLPFTYRVEKQKKMFTSIHLFHYIAQTSSAPATLFQTAPSTRSVNQPQTPKHPPQKIS